MNVELTWDPSSESDVAGYHVYWSYLPTVSANSYDGIVLVPGNTCRIPDDDEPGASPLPDGRVIYFAVDAFDLAGNTSPLSGVVSAINKFVSVSR